MYRTIPQPPGYTARLRQLTARVPKLLGLVALLAVGGCDVLFDSALDCIDSDGPTFDRRELAQPVLNQVYSETVTARIENEPRDDRFLYEFDVLGELPPGITWRQLAGSSRRVAFEGTATELGTYEITLVVAVDEPFLDDTINSGLCYTTRSRRFDLVVEPL